MVRISRDQRRTLDKFIDIAFRRSYLTDWDLWDLQVDFAPETGYWSVPSRKVKDAFREFEAYRDGVAAGIQLGLETVIRMNLNSDAAGMDAIRRYAAPLPEGFHSASRQWTVEHGMENIRIHTDAAQILEGLPESVQSSGVFDDYLEVSDKELHEYARKVSDLLAGHVRDAADDDRHVTAGLTELASYAYAYWKAEDWRFRKGEQGDEISDDALDVFLYALNKLDRLSSDGYAGPDTVNDALLAFMEAYSAGKPPLRPHKGTASAGTR